MKKVLFATTALIATGGMAAADVSLSGSGRFGIVYNSAMDAAGQSKTKIEKRMTINVDGTGSTDSGLDFGGRIRLRSDENDAASAAASANVWMGNDMFRITVGNTEGAMVNRIGYFQGSIGLTGLHWANVSFNMGSVSRFSLNTYSSRGNAGDVVRLDFNVAGFGVSLSTDSTGDHLSNRSEDAIAVSYNFGDWNVAAGYATDVFRAGAERDMFSLSAAGNIGDFGVGIQYSDLEDVASKVVLNGEYDFGQTTVAAFVAHTDEDTVGSAGIGAGNEETEYGIGFTHSLGGAVLAGGVSRNWQDETMADLGVRFNF
ncbi:porin [Neptunicoccus sediminis]|uniref:porin n=1 Tax=Neptunicoccus sediminis TaxID=1892596 RepID=UPI0008461C0D|nr:porin [Neptunicoccus sediminis]